MKEPGPDFTDERDSYYRSESGYLKEHATYLTPERTAKEADFLIKVLGLDKKDRILDMACGNGRHIVELMSRGYNVSGTDRSEFMLGQAAENLEAANLSIQLRLGDINHLLAEESLNKAYLMFADIIGFDIDSFLESLYQTLAANGKFLVDFDSTRRVIEYIRTHPESPYSFDPQNSMLAKPGESPVRYFSREDIARYLPAHNFNLVHIYGNYQESDYSEDEKEEPSPRMIIIGEKRP